MRGSVVAGVVVVGLVVGGAVLADGMLRDRAEEQLADELQSQVPLDAPPGVSIAGTPFLTQVADGELDEIHVTTATADVGGLLLHDVDVVLTGVSTEEPFTAREVVMTASVSLATLTEILGVDADLTIEDGELVATTSLIGLPLAIALTPRAAGRVIEVDLERISLAGATISADSLPASIVDEVQGMDVPLAGLPVTMELTDLTVTDVGVDFRAEGTDVALDPAALNGG